MNEAKMRKYANLLIRRGVNLQPGQLLYVEAVTETEPFITLLAEEAFAVGGSDVAVNWICSGLDRVRMENAGCSLSPNPAQQYTNDWLIENRAAYLRLDSPELHVFDGVPAGRIQEKSAGERALRTAFREKGTAQNSIACVPTLTWAKSVYPDLAPEEALERLRQITEKMEDPGMPLAELSSLYKEGRELYRYCQEALDLTEKELIILTGGEADGI